MSSHYNQHEAASAPQQQQEEAYYEGQGVAYVAPQPPPPIGYPTKEAPSGFHQQAAVPVETKTRGEGFWKGCVAAICCCWVLDFCCC